MFLLFAPILLVLFGSTVAAGTAFVLTFTHCRHAWYVPFFALVALFVSVGGILLAFLQRQLPLGLFWLLLVLGMISLVRWGYHRR